MPRSVGAHPVASLTTFSRSGCSGGLSNLLYYCSLPETHTPLYGEPSQVLMRMYGQIHSEGGESTVTESVICTLLSERNLGPKLYGVFPGGRLEEYIPVSGIGRNRAARDASPKFTVSVSKAIPEWQQMASREPACCARGRRQKGLANARVVCFGFRLAVGRLTARSFCFQLRCHATAREQGQTFFVSLSRNGGRAPGTIVKKTMVPGRESAADHSKQSERLS